eukprot:1382057-Amorphochlora_amoeboformis.AAC.1
MFRNFILVSVISRLVFLSFGPRFGGCSHNPRNASEKCHRQEGGKEKRWESLSEQHGGYGIIAPRRVLSGFSDYESEACPARH